MLIKVAKFVQGNLLDSVMEHQKSISSIWLQSHPIRNITLKLLLIAQNVLDADHLRHQYALIQISQQHIPRFNCPVFHSYKNVSLSSIKSAIGSQMLDYCHAEDLIGAYRFVNKWVYLVNFHILAEMLSFVNKHLIFTKYHQKLLSRLQLGDRTILHTHLILLMVGHVLVRRPHLPVELFIIIGSGERNLMQYLIHSFFILVYVLCSGKYDMLIRLLIEKWKHGAYFVFDNVVKADSWQRVDLYKLHVVDSIA